jgi:hypothetical protein
MRPVLETTVKDVRGGLEFSVLGAVTATQAMVGPMRKAGRERSTPWSPDG